MVAFDPVVRVLPGVVSGVGQQVGDNVGQRGSSISDDLIRFAVRDHSGREERIAPGDVAASRDQHVDDVAVLVDLALLR